MEREGGSEIDGRMQAKEVGVWCCLQLLKNGKRPMVELVSLTNTNSENFTLIPVVYLWLSLVCARSYCKPNQFTLPKESWNTWLCFCQICEQNL